MTVIGQEILIFRYFKKVLLKVSQTHFDSHWSNLGVFALPLLLELLLPQPVDDDVDADVDRRADDEEQQPHVNQLGGKSS